MKNEKIIILGKSGSGKNFLLSQLLQYDLIPCVKHTSRPKRENEIEGIDYHFVDSDYFTNNEFLTIQSFTVENNNGTEIWHYGISKSSFDESNLLIMTPGELESVVSIIDRSKCFIVYLDIDREVRQKRLHFRNDQNDSIKRRLDADDLDFSKLIDYDLRVTDPDFEYEMIYNLMN